jgi:uncharacterized protein (TIGR03435 family)
VNRTVFAALLVGASTITFAAQEATPRFEVVSIKPTGPDTSFDCKPPTCYTAFYRLQAGRFRATNMSVLELIGSAYSMATNRIVAPEWVSAARFDVEATHGLPANEQAGVMPMLQRLLEEPFSLRLHREQRPMSVWVLTKAREDGRLGPQLRPIADCSGPSTFLPAYVPCGRLVTSGATTRMGRGEWSAMALHTRLEPSVDRPVVDETGITGSFDLRLEWSDTVDDKPSLSAALRDQLGVKIEAGQRPMEVLVIDTVERPIPN